MTEPNLRFPAVFCENLPGEGASLRTSAVFCTNLRFGLSLSLCQLSSVNIFGFLRKSAVSCALQMLEIPGEGVNGGSLQVFWLPQEKFKRKSSNEFLVTVPVHPTFPARAMLWRPLSKTEFSSVSCYLPHLPCEIPEADFRQFQWLSFPRLYRVSRTSAMCI